MAKVDIRWATLQDWSTLGAIHSESYRSAYEGIMPEDYLSKFTVEQRQSYYQKALIEDNEKISLILVDDEPVGCMTIGNCRDTDLNDTFGEIWAIYLLKDFWGKGYGKMLLLWGLERLKELDYRNVSLWVLNENTSARRFYVSLGFTHDGTEQVIARGVELVQARYRKSLK